MSLGGFAIQLLNWHNVNVKWGRHITRTSKSPREKIRDGAAHKPIQHWTQTRFGVRPNLPVVGSFDHYLDIRFGVRPQFVGGRFV